ncbi:MAG: hypothetical protein AABY86_15410 [Bdellovibrionota bacterium]
MEQMQTIPSSGKTESLNHALKILNEASDTRADEIRAMIEHDFLKFKHLLRTETPKMSDLITGIQQSTAESLNQTKEKVVAATKETALKIDQNAHKNPWLFVGIAVVLSTLTGYIFANKIRR